MTTAKSSNKYLRAPFPYFGGKSMIADRVWQLLGDVKMYIEPFFGSGAVLLKRPPTKHKISYEVVNDKDGFVCNVWRSIQFSMDETARWADWPVNHADKAARQKYLIKHEQHLLDNLIADYQWHDPKLAGFWIWLACVWIGPKITLMTKNKIGGVPDLLNNTGVIGKDRGEIKKWMSALSARLRKVKVVCGDWKRVCGGNRQNRYPSCGIFFDPPYATDFRDKELYHCESLTVAKEVEEWALEKMKHKNIRMVICGYEDEYKKLLKKGWKVESWKAGGGYGNQRKKSKNENRFRERLFISPSCLQDETLLFKNK